MAKFAGNGPNRSTRLALVTQLAQILREIGGPKGFSSELCHTRCFVYTMQCDEIGDLSLNWKEFSS